MLLHLVVVIIIVVIMWSQFLAILQQFHLLLVTQLICVCSELKVSQMDHIFTTISQFFKHFHNISHLFE